VCVPDRENKNTKLPVCYCVVAAVSWLTYSGLQHTSPDTPSAPAHDQNWLTTQIWVVELAKRETRAALMYLEAAQAIDSSVLSPVEGSSSKSH
jgi:hypothetical protein